MTAPRLEKLRHFIHGVDRLHREHHQTAPLLDAVAQRLAALVRYDDWLPEEYTPPHPHPLPAVSAACRLRGALLDCQLRLGTGASDADP